MIIYLDTETTGLRPGKICQLSYVMQSADKIKSKNMFFSVDYVEPSAQMVHGFSVPKLRILSGGKRFEDLIDEIDSDFANADLIITHNVSFDFMFLRSEFENAGRVFTYKESFCSMKSMTPVCKICRKSGAGYKYPKLSELCSFFAISDYDIALASKKIFGESASFHDARFDTTAVYLAVLKGMKCIPEFEHLRNYL